MIGLGAASLWEVWQRINPLGQAIHLERGNAPERRRQSGGGRQKDAEVLCQLLVTLLYLRQQKSFGCALGCMNW